MRYVKLLHRTLPRSNFLSQRRFFLSQAFECTEVWNNRLSNPLIMKVESESLYYDLNGIFNKTRKMNPIDYDLFVNALQDDKFLTEVEELAYKLRQTAETCSTLPTTHHAFIRLFMNSDKIEDFIRILHDRMNYGIFPDNYCMVYILNRLLKKQDFRSAARVASLKMFQEDFSDDLVKYLSLYSVLKYLPTNLPWNNSNAEKEEANEEEEEEEIKVKVRILRNPFFDDHFDLTDGKHICGKTLAMIGANMPGDIGDSAKVMGFALYNKWDKLASSLNEIVKSENKLYEESVTLVKNTVKEKIPEEEKAQTILSLLRSFEDERLIKKSMADDVQKLIEEEVARSEKNRIEVQEKLYQEWENLRKEKLEAHLEELTRKKRLQEVERMKVELTQKEELLYFFDREDEIEVVVENKETLRKKREYHEKVKIIEDEYIPPETQQRQSR